MRSEESAKDSVKNYLSETINGKGKKIENISFFRVLSCMHRFIIINFKVFIVL